VGLLLAAAVAATLALGGLAVVTGTHHRLYRYVLYPVVAHRVTQGAASRDEAVARLNEFVYVNVRSLWPAVPTIDDSAADTLIRGFGACDPAVMAFIRLAYELDVSGRMLFLRREDGVSPHTVAEVFLDGGWRVFDTLYGFVPRRPDGGVATKTDLAREPGLLRPSRAEPAWYRGADPVEVREVTADPLEAAASAIGRALAALPAWAVDRLQDLYLSLPPPRYVDVDGQVFEDYRTPDRRLFYAARNYQVFLRTAEAKAAYAGLLAQYPDSPYADDALYQTGLLELTQNGRPREAALTMETLGSRYPSSPWKGEAAFFQARALEAAGECARAKALYQEVARSDANGMEDARARLERLHCA
jgi:hypothetical protein